MKRQRLTEPLRVYFAELHNKIILEDGEHGAEVIQDFPELLTKISPQRDVEAPGSLQKHYNSEIKNLGSQWIWQEDANWNYRGLGKHIRLLYAEQVKTPTRAAKSFPNEALLLLRFKTAAECPLELCKSLLLTIAKEDNIFSVLGIAASGLVEMQFPIAGQMQRSFFDRLFKHELFFTSAHHVNVLKSLMGKYTYSGDEAGFKIISAIIGGESMSKGLAELMQKTEGRDAQLLHRTYLISTGYERPINAEEGKVAYRVGLVLFLMVQAKPEIFDLEFVGKMSFYTSLQLVEYPNTEGTCYANAALRLLQASETLITVLPQLVSDYGLHFREILAPSVLNDLPKLLDFIRQTLGIEQVRGGTMSDFLDAIAQELVYSEGYEPLRDVVNVEADIVLCMQCHKFKQMPEPVYKLEQRPRAASAKACLDHLRKTLQNSETATDALNRWVQAGYVEISDAKVGEAFYVPLLQSRRLCPVNCGLEPVDVRELPVRIKDIPEPNIFTLPRPMRLQNRFHIDDVEYEVIMRLLPFAETKQGAPHHVRNLIYAQPGKHPDILLDDDETTVLAKEDVAENLRAASAYLQRYKGDPDLVVAYPVEDELPAFDYLSMTFMHPGRVSSLFAKPIPALLPESAWFAHLRGMIEELRKRWWDV